MKGSAKEIFSEIAIKSKDIIVGLIVSFSSFVSPISAILLIMVGFVLFDTLIAIYKVVMLEGWKGYKSGKLFNIAVKLCFYFGALILGFAIDTFIIESTLFGVTSLITKIIAVMFIYIEVKSIDETQTKLTGRSFWTVLKEILNRAKDLKKDVNEVKND